MNLVNKLALVYFGHVSQRDDEHHMVRGVTVSNKHKDDHYCIGTYDSYDTIFVEWSDTLHNGNSHVWHIIEVDLKLLAKFRTCSLVPMQYSLTGHELLKTKYHSMLAHTMGSVHVPCCVYVFIYCIHYASARHQYRATYYARSRAER